MSQVIYYFFYILGTSSLIISLIGTIQILINDFKGSKIFWIIILQMAIIGPILYLTKGRKYIIRQEEKGKKKRGAIRKLINECSLFTIYSLLIGFTFIVFGIIVKATDVSFFWESRQIGYLIFSFGLIGLLRASISIRVVENKKSFWSKLMIGFILFILFYKLTKVVVVLTTGTYSTAKQYLKDTNVYVNEIGEIQFYTLLTRSKVRISKDKYRDARSARIVFYLKGDKGYRKAKIILRKYPDTDWVVEDYD